MNACCVHVKTWSACGTASLRSCRAKKLGLYMAIEANFLVQYGRERVFGLEKAGGHYPRGASGPLGTGHANDDSELGEWGDADPAGGGNRMYHLGATAQAGESRAWPGDPDLRRRADVYRSLRAAT